MRRTAGSAALPCRALFLDAGGVLALPHQELVAAALERAGVRIAAAQVPRAHYRAVRELDGGGRSGYLDALTRALGVPDSRRDDAVDVLSRLADRAQSGEILWSEPVPDAMATIATARRAGIAVVVVTNSDGHAAENLHDAGICQTTTGVGERVDAIIDSTLVGSAKPDPEIFEVAMRTVRVQPEAVVHIGDTVSTDIVGAQAAGIVAIHLDPVRSCAANDHRHVRGLREIWTHVAPVRAG